LAGGKDGLQDITKWVQGSFKPLATQGRQMYQDRRTFFVANFVLSFVDKASDKGSQTSGAVVPALPGQLARSGDLSHRPRKSNRGRKQALRG
jgi:hypothetical protein